MASNYTESAQDTIHRIFSPSQKFAKFLYTPKEIEDPFEKAPGQIGEVFAVLIGQAEQNVTDLLDELQGMVGPITVDADTDNYYPADIKGNARLKLQAAESGQDQTTTPEPQRTTRTDIYGPDITEKDPDLATFARHRQQRRPLHKNRTLVNAREERIGREELEQAFLPDIWNLFGYNHVIELMDVETCNLEEAEYGITVMEFRARIVQTRPRQRYDNVRTAQRRG